MKLLNGNFGPLPAVDRVDDVQLSAVESEFEAANLLSDLVAEKPDAHKRRRQQ